MSEIAHTGKPTRRLSSPPHVSLGREKLLTLSNRQEGRLREGARPRRFQPFILPGGGVGGRYIVPLCF